MSSVTLQATRKNPLSALQRPLSPPQTPIRPAPSQIPATPHHLPDLSLPDPDPIQASDLRRRRSRLLADRLVSRADFLLPEDRALIRAVFRDGLTAQAVARAARVSPRTTRLRIRLLVRRLLSHRYTFVVAQRDLWPAGRRRVATAHILQGRTFRQTAAHLRMTVHHVRRELAAVRALIDADAQSRDPAPTSPSLQHRLEAAR